MTRPRLLDLFCGFGGCSVGYARAGFDVVGVDWAMCRDYPYEIHRRNAMSFPLDGFDVVHASPPCKLYTGLRQFEATRQDRLFPIDEDLLLPTLERLRAWGGLWVVENVPGAPMPEDSITLCGSMFGLGVRRHRLFASSFPLVAPACDHEAQGSVVTVAGLGGRSKRMNKAWGAEGAKALGIDWTTDQAGLSQAIPPAYTAHIGQQLYEMALT